MPDLVVILESQHWNLKDFSGAAGWRAPAALDLSSLPGSARVLKGKTCIFMTPWTDLHIFNRLREKGLLPSGLSPLGSVGLTAVQLARRLTKGPVITGGIDFSFTMDGYHARSSPGHLAKLASLTRFSSCLNAAAAFRYGCYPAQSKNGIMVRSDPAMRNYRELFEQEFSGDKGIFDIQGPGLPLGVKTLSFDEAAKILANHKAEEAEKSEEIQSREKTGRLEFSREDLVEFILKEKERLHSLRDILTGARPGTDNPEGLLDDCDYLWAHFPDCAGAGGRRPASSVLSFLKRVRAEIDPFLKLWDMTLREIQGIKNFYPKV
jgi:hypothetical protein